ncbi:MAG: DUF2075 domain-containing protein [Oscillibacter sp.]|nr:DUF2075 domain-containing protein [Oscillibacter sp.]
MEHAKHMYCCYSSSIGEFLAEDKSEWIEKMKTSFTTMIEMPLGESQIRAWKDCFDVLVEQLPEIAKTHPNFDIVFEYCLPYESGRRPDVLLISKEQVIVLEFKQNFRVIHADIDQAAAYARDIHEYHYESRNSKVSAILVLTHADESAADIDVTTGVTIAPRPTLASAIIRELEEQNTRTDINQWLNSKYEPLPTIVEAAKLFVKQEELPNIRRVNSTCIPQAIECLTEISTYAEEQKKHVVAFVTGVPGAGKTFLGLKYVYDICKSSEHVNSVYLSGNGPLVSVLTQALHSSVFVKDLHKVVNQYLSNGAPDFHNNVVVFDEGQRAWDAQQMAAKRHTNKSEPDIMIELCEKRLDWCVLLVLVGEGQEIHNGENSGIVQWDTAISKSDIDWEIICPDKLVNVFSGKSIIENKNRSALNLSMSLRTHLAGDVSKFANALVDGDIVAAKSLSDGILKQGFGMYVTRDLNHAKRYLRERYRNEPTKRFGMIASSKGRLLRHWGMDNSFQGALGIFYVGKWFNAEADHPKSCCALDTVATEFSCQGLEIDMPLIGWDNDMLWDGAQWTKFKKAEAENSDVNTYRKNSYRVLLTRGRDGFVIYVPPVEEMDPVYAVLLESGIKTVEYHG